MLSTELERDLPPEERDRMLDRIADEVVRRRMEVPAVLALEMHRPLTFLGSQALVVFTPMLAPAFGLDNLQKLSKLLEERANLDRLLDRIEDLAADRDRGTEPSHHGDTETRSHGRGNRGEPLDTEGHRRTREGTQKGNVPFLRAGSKGGSAPPTLNRTEHRKDRNTDERPGA
jgi:hypothetical protein